MEGLYYPGSVIRVINPKSLTSLLLKRDFFAPQTLPIQALAQRDASTVIVEEQPTYILHRYSSYRYIILYRNTSKFLKKRKYMENSAKMPATTIPTQTRRNRYTKEKDKVGVPAVYGTAHLASPDCATAHSCEHLRAVSNNNKAE